MNKIKLKNGYLEQKCTTLKCKAMFSALIAKCSYYTKFNNIGYQINEKELIKYSIKEVADIVQYKGLGYAVSSYLSHDCIEDKELSALWKQCHEAIHSIDWEPYYESMKKIEDRLGGYYD